MEGKAGDNFNEAQFRLWIPPQTKPKGVLVVLQGSGMCGLHLADDPGWQKLASELDHALLAYYITESQNGKLFHHAEGGSGQALLEGLNHLARDSGHLELADAPLALVGFSVGGQFAYHFSQWQPDRTSAFITMKGGYHRMPQEGAPPVSGLLIAGEKDADFRVQNLSALHAEGEKRRAPWRFVIEPGAGHACENASKLIAPFFKSVMLPDGKPALDEALAGFAKDPAQLPLPQLSFESLQPKSLATASAWQLDFGPVPWNKGSDWKELTLQAQDNPAAFDHCNVQSLQGLVEIKQAGKERLSLRILPKQEQILGSFHDELLVTFEKAGSKRLGAVRIPVFFRSKGDVEIKPYTLWVQRKPGASQQDIEFQVIHLKEGALELKSAQSSLECGNISWKSLGENRYTFACTLGGLGKAQAKEQVTLRLQGASQSITCPVSLFFK